MTIEEAVNKIKHLKYKALQGAIIVHDTYSDDYELLNESALTALDMATASLEAWEKVRQEIDESRDALKTMTEGEWFAGKLKGLDCAVAIIDEHLQEIKNG